MWWSCDQEVSYLMLFMGPSLTSFDCTYLFTVYTSITHVNFISAWTDPTVTLHCKEERYVHVHVYFASFSRYGIYTTCDSSIRFPFSTPLFPLSYPPTLKSSLIAFPFTSLLAHPSFPSRLLLLLYLYSSLKDLWGCPEVLSQWGWGICIPAHCHFLWATDICTFYHTYTHHLYFHHKSATLTLLFYNV